ncbi:MAG: hypothetical protein R3321_01170 [Nitrososphaeraceae archaeon]|nr:hypothetical protein [Nitrososphaeraceae archaeon]
MTEILEYNGKNYRKCTKEELEFVKQARGSAAKPSNFAILYGGSVSAVSGSITKTFPDMPEAEVKTCASKVLKSKKGIRPRGSDYFYGGAWSSAFNTMRDISFNSEIPELPLLKSKISTALRPSAVGDDFTTGRLNWSIQGSGAEILSALIVMMHWLVDYYEIEAHFVVSIHDRHICCG